MDEYDSNDPVIDDIIYRIHLKKTLTSPIHIHKFPTIQINIDKIDDKKLTECYEECFTKYKNTLIGSRNSSVDVHTGTWINIFLDYMDIAIKNKDDEALIPNGISDNPYCNLKLFYEILYDYFKH
tara:strand:- start:149 stop:523 length:375 start_codon:yes stop_codon:yes gene_type:complete